MKRKITVNCPYCEETYDKITDDEGEILCLCPFCGEIFVWEE